MDVSIQIQKDIKEFLEKMGFFTLNAPSVQNKDGIFFINIFINNPKEVIGYRGESFQAIQHIFQLIVLSKYGPDIKINIDVNGYRKKRESIVKEKAFSARRKCIEQKSKVELSPMSAYDRKIVHSTLVSFRDIQTHSTGIGRDRRVIVDLAKQE